MSAQQGWTPMGRMFWTFWKPIFAGLAMLHVIAAVLIVRAVAPDAPAYANVVAVLVAVAVTFVEMEVIGRALVGPEAALFRWGDRTTKLITIGYAVALAAAVGLLAHEVSGRRVARESEARQAAEDEQRRRMLADPKVQRANEVLRKRQEQRGR